MAIAIVFLPLLGAIIAGFFGKKIGDKGAQFVTCSLLLVATVLAWITFFQVTVGGHPYSTTLMEWVSVGDFKFNWALKVDSLTAVMLIVVTTVSSVVHFYSIGYMEHDKSIPRFFSYLSFFTFSMLMLVTSDNLVQMFFGWEGVGVASYLLIGFWYTRPAACAAAIKAFLVNRVGDIGFALGIFTVFVITGSVQFSEIFPQISALSTQNFHFLGMDGNFVTVACLLLFLGAMGKSAQLGLHTWLPDAMEGPTPVSALIHAATMVTAGVFMVCRLSPIFEYSQTALTVMTIVGGLTAFFAATVALTQNDIKKVIAYSTCSQLGYMFFAAGVSAYQAAMFHLMTHAFFKALLFLGAGSVIHAMSDEQDMRKMGGLWKKIPYTYAYIWIGSLSLAGMGVPELFGFSGFYSKDMLLESAWGAGTSVGVFAYWMGVIAAFMTAFYSGRLIFMTFHGKNRSDERTWAHVHESSRAMLIPLVILALGAIFAGVIAYGDFVGIDMQHFWGNSIFVKAGHDALRNAHEVPQWVKLMPLVMGLCGLGLSWFFYMGKGGKAWLDGLVKVFHPVYVFFLNKWYFDELYDWLFVRPAFRLGRILWKRGDEQTIDAFGPDGVARVTFITSRFVGRLQSGYIYHYAFAMLVGVVAFVAWYLFRTTV